MQCLTHKTEGGPCWARALFLIVTLQADVPGPSFASCHITRVGIGAEGEASAALLSESIKHPFLLEMCSLSSSGILLSPALPWGLNLRRFLIRGQAGRKSGTHNLAVGPGASRKPGMLFPFWFSKQEGAVFPSGDPQGQGEFSHIRKEGRNVF